MFDIPFFNEEVIREVINNAFAHRDYRLASEIVIKQYPTKLSVISPGGFPIGVTLENILTVSSTPRNRLLADVLAATGIVERSGQGMDVIFRLTLSEGKQTPDYSKTNDYQVTAILSATVKDPGFALFIKSIQQELPENQKLSVFDVLTFCAIREGKSLKIRKSPRGCILWAILKNGVRLRLFAIYCLADITNSPAINQSIQNLQIGTMNRFGVYYFVILRNTVQPRKPILQS